MQKQHGHVTLVKQFFNNFSIVIVSMLNLAKSNAVAKYSLTVLGLLGCL